MKIENNDATKWTKWSLKDRKYVINNEESWLTL